MKGLPLRQWSISALGIGILLSQSVLGDDTEIFFGEKNQPTASRPNILMILDTSGSMDDHVVTQPIYDPNTTYPGSCNAGRIYYSTNATPPECTTNNWFNSTALVCADAKADFASSTGFYYGRVGRHRSDNGNWVSLNSQVSQRDSIIECEEDWGVDGGKTSTTTLRYPQNNLANPYRANTSGAINWGGYTAYRLYNANYINWYRENRLSTLSKMEIVKDVSKNLVTTISNVNMGLMRFSNNDEDNSTENLRAQGGMILHEVADVAESRDSILSTIDTFQPRGYTPLSEVMYEAGLYYRGSKWDYGSRSRGYSEETLLSVAGSRRTDDNTFYKTPIKYACQKNYVVYLTDGLPTADSDAVTKIQTLIGKNCDGTGQGRCLDDTAEFLFRNDNVATLDGDQNVATYTIGFDADFPLLESTATRAGGKYYTANDTGSLVSALSSIVEEISATSATFSAPAVSVNAFNRSQNLQDLFVTVFKPSNTARWAGNLKRYRLDPASGELEDANGAAAVDPATGFFKDSAQDLWATSPDGNNVERGGAANLIPAAQDRKVYTYYAGSPSTTLTNAANAFATSNTYLTATRLEIGDPGDPSVADLIDWARGAVVNDDETLDVTKSRGEMGDPLHSRPATVIYSATAANPLSDAVVYVATNDGYVHAIDADTGVELWAFIPSEMWPRLHVLKENAQVDSKSYGIDGNIVIAKTDDNGNGKVDDTDRVYLYFGMRRGGDTYYALDVTDKTAPKFMWRLTPTELQGLGQTWSTPQPARIRVGTTTRKTLVFGGGYETDQDPNSSGETSHSTDSVGNRLFIVDAVSGDLIWSAGSTATQSLQLTDMQYSVPSDVRVVDVNNDTFADRIYFGDMGGQVWRFDILNGNAADKLVNGGVIASLGNAHETTHPASSLRRFYYAPSISLVRRDDLVFLNVGIGSGYREGPLNTQTEDRFYSIRDRNVFNQLSQDDYEGLNVVTDDELVDITDGTNKIGDDDFGWKYALPRAGEKTVAEARTFNYQAFFTSYTPSDGSNADDPCLPQAGTNRLYVLDLVSGYVRYIDEMVGDLAAEPVILFPPPPPPCKAGDPSCEEPPAPCLPGQDCEPEPPCDGTDPECKDPEPEKCLPGEPCEAACLWELGSCPGDLSNPAVRTFWRQQDIDTPDPTP